MFHQKSGFLADIMIIFFCMVSFAGSPVNAGEVHTLTADKLPKHYREGNIYKKTDDSLIIDDMVYKLAPDVVLLDEAGKSTGMRSFSEGAFVGYRLDTAGEIIELRRIVSDEKVGTAEGYRDEAGEMRNNTGAGMVYQEDGVWKNR